MSEHYTDDDVQAALAAARVDTAEEESLLETLGISEDYMASVVIRLVLDAAAPAIAARALREAADAMLPPYNCELRYDGTEDPEVARWVGYCAETDRLLRDRAEGIEKVTWCDECFGARSIVDEFEDQVGFEEQAREVWVTALDCGHSISRPLKGHVS